MPTVFPGSIDAYVPKVNDPGGDEIIAEHINDLQDPMVAVQTKLGVDASADPTSIDYLLKNPLSSDPGHTHTDASISTIDASKLVGVGLTVGHALFANTPTTVTFRAIQEVDIVDGGLLARIGDNESITGIWSFTRISRFKIITGTTTELIDVNPLNSPNTIILADGEGITFWNATPLGTGAAEVGLIRGGTQELRVHAGNPAAATSWGKVGAKSFKIYNPATGLDWTEHVFTGGSGQHTYVWPLTGPPASAQVLQSDAFGNLSWVPGGGGGTPGTPLDSLQYNNAGAFDGTDFFFYSAGTLNGRTPAVKTIIIDPVSYETIHNSFYVFKWTDNIAADAGAIDVALERSGAGLLKVSDGAFGYRGLGVSDLYVRGTAGVFSDFTTDGNIYLNHEGQKRAWAANLAVTQLGWNAAILGIDQATGTTSEWAIAAYRDAGGWKYSTGAAAAKIQLVGGAALRMSVAAAGAPGNPVIWEDKFYSSPNGGQGLSLWHQRMILATGLQVAPADGITFRDQQVGGPSRLYVVHGAGGELETARLEFHQQNINTAGGYIEHGNFWGVFTICAEAGQALEFINSGTSFLWPTSHGGAGYVLTTNGTGQLSFQPASASVAISSLLDAAAANTLNNAAYEQTWNWTSLAAGETALTLTATGTGTVLDIFANGGTRGIHIDASSGSGDYGLKIEMGTSLLANHALELIGPTAPVAEITRTTINSLGTSLHLRVENLIGTLSTTQQNQIQFRSRDTAEPDRVSGTLAVIHRGNFNNTYFRLQNQNAATLVNTAEFHTERTFLTGLFVGLRSGWSTAGVNDGIDQIAYCVSGGEVKVAIGNGQGTPSTPYELTLSDDVAIGWKNNNDANFSLTDVALERVSNGTLRLNNGISGPGNEADLLLRYVQFTTTGAAIAMGAQAGAGSPSYLWPGESAADDGFFLRNIAGGVLDWVAGSTMNVRSVSASGSIAATDEVVVVNTSSGAKTMTLPDATADTGKVFHIKNYRTTGQNRVIVQTSLAQTIDGKSSIYLGSWDALMVISDGSNWLII